jgi:single-strand DNA-binding protein
MLIGNLGKDPELQVTSDGTPFTRFSLAVNRTYKSASGEKMEETDWFNIVAWRQLAEICERYLLKGSKVNLEGRLAQRKYTDKNRIERCDGYFGHPFRKSVCLARLNKLPCRSM